MAEMRGSGCARSVGSRGDALARVGVQVALAHAGSVPRGGVWSLIDRAVDRLIGLGDEPIGLSP
jgi:hypothetical protein